MFESIKDALAKQQKQGSGTSKDIMSLEVGKTYLVRLLPNMKAPDKTWFKYYNFGWKSFSTGGYVQAVSPTTWGERDPIAEERVKIYRSGTDKEKEKIKEVRRSEKYLINVYVISDPTNPENNGKVKILRYGKQLNNVIDSAISGEDAAEYGDKVFDLSPNGVNLKIKVDDQGGFPNYTASRFTSAADLKLSDEQIASTYDQVHDLEKVFTVKSYEDLKKMWEDHFLCKSSDEGKSTNYYPPNTPDNLGEYAADSTSDGTPVGDDEELKKLLEGI